MNNLLDFNTFIIVGILLAYCFIMVYNKYLYINKNTTDNLINAYVELQRIKINANKKRNQKYS